LLYAIKNLIERSGSTVTYLSSAYSYYVRISLITFVNWSVSYFIFFESIKSIDSLNIKNIFLGAIVWYMPLEFSSILAFPS